MRALIRRRSRARSVVVGATITAALCGCGALPPQAPSAYAKKIDSATSGISTDCGYAYRATAFPGDHTRDLNELEASASTYVRTLVNVFRRNRGWVYQGDTVAEISSDAVATLDSCGLHAAADQLRRATTASS